MLYVTDPSNLCIMTASKLGPAAGSFTRCRAVYRSSQHKPATSHFSSNSRVSPVCSYKQPNSLLLGRRRNLGLLFGGGVATMTNLKSFTAQAAQQNVTDVLKNATWPEEFPLSPEAFGRYDESPDSVFYSYPRFVTHIDDNAIKALTEHYAKVFPAAGGDGVALLDICSSWISHYPKGYKAGKVSGLGMNAEELQRNEILTDYSVKDLNEDPTLPYPDNTFDVVTNCVSVDYLTKPLQVFQEVHRVLKPGGLYINSFSNRCFPTKAIAIWTQTGDAEHIYIVGSYFKYSVPGGWSEPDAQDITKKQLLGYSDPMYVVSATKTA